jgi:ABC-type sugar transport system ATPase subunit
LRQVDLLRMLAGLENITSGTISIGDKVVNNVQPKERDIAMVFQNYALYPHMTVADNMGFSLKLRGAAPRKSPSGVKRAAEILALTPLLERYPRQLSGGQRQRVAMGRAIVRDPQVFLFDEPLSNLDAKLRVAMRTEIKELHQRLRTTTVYVTHDQIEAMTMADKIVVMHDGIVEQMGTPLELYDTPANQFVAGFIGSPAMNFLKGKVKSNGSAGFEGRTASSCRWRRRRPIRKGSRRSTACGPSISPSPMTAPKPRSSWSSRPARKPRCSPSSAASRSSPCSASASIQSGRQGPAEAGSGARASVRRDDGKATERLTK